MELNEMKLNQDVPQSGSFGEHLLTLLYKAWGAGIYPKPLQIDAHGLKTTSISLIT